MKKARSVSALQALLVIDYQSWRRSERNIVVEPATTAAFIAARRRTAIFGRGRTRRTAFAATRSTASAAPTTRTAAAAEHLHVASDDFGRVAVLAFLVLPLASAQAALNIDL